MTDDDKLSEMDGELFKCTENECGNHVLEVWKTDDGPIIVCRNCGHHHDDFLNSEMKEACVKMIEGSIPYLANHQAFLIKADDWERIADLVLPGMKGLNELLERFNNGEKLSQEEIKRVLDLQK